MKHEKSRRRIIVCCTVILAFFTTIHAYADEYYDFRDGDINLVLPDNWEVREVEAQDSEGKPCEHILTARETGTDSEQALNLDVYFSYDEVSDDEYFYLSGDEETAMEYYELYGEEAVENLYIDCLLRDSSSSGISLEQAEFFDGEWNGFLKVGVYVQADIDGDRKEENRSDVVYITAAMTDDSNYVVNEMLVFSNAAAAGSGDFDRSVIESIADGFYDYGYDTEMTKDYSTDGYYENSGISAGEFMADIMSAIIPIIILIAAAVAAVKFRSKRKNGTGDFALAKDDSSWVNVAPQAKAGRKAGKTKKLSKANLANSGQTVYKTAQSWDLVNDEVERGYMESLKTLYKSGLLTKNEMNEMIEKHRQRNNRRGG